MYFHVTLVLMWMAKEPANKGMLDLIVLVLLVLYLVFWYFGQTKEARENDFYKTTEVAVLMMNNVIGLITAAILILFLYTFIYLFSIPMTESSKPGTILFFEFAFWCIFVFSLISVVSYGILRLDIGSYLLLFFDRFWNGKEIFKHDFLSEKHRLSDDTKQKEEVFNVAQDLYTYDDAQALCTAFGGRLATYNEIEDAYKDGAEWCNYGWSDGQMIFFPTQKKTFDSLQTTKNKNACGRPGINGGYVKNSKLRFGVNCFGTKPPPSAADTLLLEQKHSGKIGPRSAYDKALEMKVQYFKENGDKFIQINSFNNDQWSAY